MFDYSRVEQVLTQTAALTPAEIIARLVAEGERWMKGALQEDDITLLVIRKT
jgi:serine phosphatase RsbU (regulator of sigma subunit)